MRSWGDVNKTLNERVRAGELASFRTNGAEAARTGSLEIRIAPADGVDPEEARRVVLRELARLGIVAEVVLADEAEGSAR
jgi:hypothetical protein